MSNRSEDDSRPSMGALSQRATVREVPAAKFKDGSVGTVAPRGLRGPSLLPGQGAPERIAPEDVELAVLRDAETLDGPKVARTVVGKRALPEPRSATPTPVSVEVPRARSMPPAAGAYGSTPPTPSARSIQSGTLMSIGSVDPRAPTELSLPSPRPMSVSERVAYLGPEAVVDRAAPSLKRAEPTAADRRRSADLTARPGPPSARQLPSQPVPSRPAPAQSLPSQPAPSRPAPSQSLPSQPAPSRPATSQSVRPQPVPSRPPPSRALPSQPVPSRPAPSQSSRSPSSPSQPVPSQFAPSANARSAAPGPTLSPSVRPSSKADSVAPPAQRLPRSYSPAVLSPTPTPMRPPRPTPTPMRPPRPTSKPPRPEPASSVPPPVSSAASVPPQFQIHSELDAIPHEDHEDAFDLRSVSTQREPLASRKAQPPADWPPPEPVTAPASEGELRARSNRSSSPAVTILVDRGRASPPQADERALPPRAAVPLSWVLGAATFAVILALIAAFALRPSAPVQAVSPLDGRASAAAPSTAEVAPRDALPPAVAPGAKRAGAASAARPSGAPPKVTSSRALGGAAASGSASPAASADPKDPNFKVHQSIY